MTKEKSPKASVGDIARAAKVSRTAVAFALQNRPGVSESTRQRILRIAGELGYAPDARVASWMATVRKAKVKDLLPVAWLNTGPEKDSWQKYKFHSPALEGARERCRQLGYRLEEIWTQQPGMTMKRLSKILYQRGIEGVIVTYPARHLRLNWDHLACVAFGGSLLAPRHHCVIPDNYFNLTLTLKMLRRYGYRRIGICLSEQTDRFVHRIFSTLASHLYAMSLPAERVKPLFLARATRTDHDKKAQIAAWLKCNRPEVIIGHDNNLVHWVEELGYRVPHDVSIVHLAIDDDVLDWAGIHSKRRAMGMTAAEWLISLMRNHQFGVPETALNIQIRGSWRFGRTLLIPKPK